MNSATKRQEIDHRTIKLIVGIIAISLAGLTSLFSNNKITSISESYYIGGLPQTIFIGFLFAIAALLMAYNGQSRREMILSKIAALAGLVVALFPCKCSGHVEAIPYLHGLAASVMFFILAFFCYLFFKRAKAKGYPQAHARAMIYAICGLCIVLSILVLGYDELTTQSLSARCARLIFWGEAIGLVAFGISWLTASRVLPILTLESERFSPMRDSNPD